MKIKKKTFYRQKKIKETRKIRNYETPIGYNNSREVGEKCEGNIQNA